MRLPSSQGLASGGSSRGDEASTAEQPATGGRSRRSPRRWFVRLVQEDQRLKKHYGRWMDIARSLELESFILTKLTKPSIPVNLVGPQVSLPLWWVPAIAGGVFIFLCVIRRHFLAYEDIAGGSELSEPTAGRQEHAARPALVWAAGARRPEVEEALQPLDEHRMVTGSRIVHID